MISGGAVQFAVAYQLSPIVLTGGLAGNIPGGMLPIISLLQSRDYDLGVLSTSSQLDPDEFFAQFTPLPSGSLIENQVGHYPFVNQAVAANAIIADPLHVSLLMQCPARDPGSYNSRQSILTSLQGSISQHIAQGGMFNVATPAYIYTNCLLLSLKDITATGATAQPQIQWQWDFEQPLVTLQAAQAAQNNSMSKITSQTQNAGDPPGSIPAQNAVGQPGSGQAANVVPAAQQPPATSVPGPQPLAGGPP
jgi:hypothetical protein